MSQDDLKNRASQLLEQAGIRIDGDAPIDLRVHDERLYARVFAHGSLAMTVLGIALTRSLLRH